MGIIYSHPYLQKLPQFSLYHDVSILRLDIVHPYINGNKGFKLKHHLEAAIQLGATTLCTMGGGWSNHLASVAACAQELGLKSKAWIRGYYPNSTETLQFCENMGMSLNFTEKEVFNTYRNTPPLLNKHDYWIPEGGGGELGENGIKEIAQYIPAECNTVVVSVGTGTTIKGLKRVLPGKRIIGFVPMKNGAQMANQWENTEVELIDDYHFGGFGRHTDELINFMNEMYATYELPLDVVYTSKMMYGLKEILNNHSDDILINGPICAIHTGGLQGNQSINSNLNFDF